jgi:hypothetical protein
MEYNPYKDLVAVEPSIQDKATRLVESGDRQFNKDGSVVTSSAGALGSSQLMMATGPEAAKLAGLDWDPYKLMYDKGYNDTLGSAYLAKKTADFAGDSRKGHAAYNAGTGGVNKAIARAATRGGTWESHLPEETKNYLVKMDAAKSRLGAAPTEDSGTYNPYTDLIPQTGSDFNPYVKLLNRPAVLPTKPVEEEQSGLASFISHAASSLLPSAAFVTGGSAAAAAAAPFAVASGLAAPFVEGGVFLLGGLLTSTAASAIQTAILPDKVKNYLAVGEDQNPYSSFAGEIASFAPVSKIGLATKVLKSGKTVIDKPMAAALAGVGGAFEAGSEYIQTGEVDPIKVGISALATPFMGKGLNKLGTAISVKAPVVPPTALELQNREINAKFEDGLNATDLSAMEAHLTDVNIRKDILGNDPNSTPEMDTIKLKTVFDALGKNKDGTQQLNTLIMEDHKVSGWRKRMSGESDVKKFEADTLDQRLQDPTFLSTATPDDIKFLEIEIAGKRRTAESLDAVIAKKDLIGSTEHLIPVLSNIRNIFDEMGKKAVDSKVLSGLLYNYVPSIIDRSQSKLTSEGIADAISGFYKLKETSFKTDSAQERMFNTARDLQEYLNSIGSDLYVHTDIATVTSAYMKSMSKAIIQKDLIEELKGIKVIGSNLPIITEDSVQAMANKYVAYTSNGAKQLENAWVHPDYAPTMDHMFSRTDIGAVKNSLLQVAMLTKALNVIGSFFHAPSLGWALGGASPKTAFKEIVTGGSGIRKAVTDLRQGFMSEYTELAISSGTKIGTEDVKRTIVSDIGAFIDQRLFSGNKVLRQVTNPLDKYVLQKMNTFTWDYMHTGGKLLLFKDLMTKAEANITSPRGSAAYTKERFELAKKVSNSVNHTMGGLQWLQAANSIKGKLSRELAISGSGIESRAWGQVAMFAPDWTVSTLGAFLKGMPDELLKPQRWDVKGGIKGILKPMNEADLSRVYMVNTGLMYLTLLNAINLATSGQFIWQNEDPTRIQHADGTTQQLAKHSMEAVHWLMDPIKTLKNKLGFAPKAGLALIDDMGGDYIDRAGTIAKLALPFSAGSAMQAPKGEELKRLLYSTAGFPIYGKPDNQFRDPTDLLQEHIDRLKVRRDNKMKKVDEMQRLANKPTLHSLFSDYM